MTDAKQATGAAQLPEHILNPNIAKSDSEWWAKDRIEQLEAELARAKDNFSDLEQRHNNYVATRVALKAELAVRAKQIGVACLKHDLTHSLACGRCLHEAEKEIAALKAQGEPVRGVAYSEDYGVSLCNRGEELFHGNFLYIHPPQAENLDAEITRLTKQMDELVAAAKDVAYDEEGYTLRPDLAEAIENYEALAKVKEQK